MCIVEIQIQFSQVVKELESCYKFRKLVSNSVFQPLEYLRQTVTNDPVHVHLST